MKYQAILIVLCLALAAVVGQRLLGPYSIGDFQSLQAMARDPRQNRGPVVFPPSPPDAIEETSGVVVGASGYGFVPPHQSPPIYLNELDSPATPYTAYQFYETPYTQRISFF